MRVRRGRPLPEAMRFRRPATTHSRVKASFLLRARLSRATDSVPRKVGQRIATPQGRCPTPMSVSLRSVRASITETSCERPLAT